MHLLYIGPNLLSEITYLEGIIGGYKIKFKFLRKLRRLRVKNDKFSGMINLIMLTRSELKVNNKIRGKTHLLNATYSIINNFNSSSSQF